MSNENLLNNINNNSNNIDFKEVLKSILRYKWMILSFTVLFTIASAVFAYLKPNIYYSSTTLEIVNKKGGAGATDFMMEAFGGSSVNVSNEIEVFKSRYLAKRAFEYLDLNTRYYETKNFKTTELYKNSPFVVSKNYIEDEVANRTFVISAVDKDSFRLELEPVGFLYKTLGLSSDQITYNKIHKYGENITNEYFSLKVERVFDLHKKSKYGFNFSSDLAMFHKLNSGLSVSQLSRSSTIIKLTLQDTSSLRAKEYLNALVKAYMIEEVEQKTKEANLTIEFIDDQLNSINERLKVSENNLETFKEKNKVVGLTEQASMITNKMSSLEAKLEELQIEINILSNIKRFINSNEDLAGLSVGAVSFADPSLGTLIASLQKEVSNKATLLVNYTEIHPDVIKTKQNISTLKRSIKATLDSNLTQLEQRKTSINNNIKKYNKTITTLPKQESQLSRLTRFYSIDEKIYSFLLEKKAETAILKSSTISKSRLLDSSLENKIPIKPKKRIIVLIGMILGFVIGLAYAFLREFFNNTVKNSDDIERLCDISIYGIVPNKTKKQANLVDEAFRAIRTNLQFLPKHDKSNIIAITSSVSGEGKTTTTANLGKIISQTGKKVVLLDLDLRKSNLHKEFGIPNNVGISSYLSEQNSLEEITQNVQENVDILTTGRLPPNPSELILTDNFKDMLETLKAKYDYVIMDTPPVGLVTDALILMNYADINFVIARASYTRKEFVKNLDRLSKEHNQHTFGLILNGVEIGEKYGYGYGSNYGYGYGNSKYYQNR